MGFRFCKWNSALNKNNINCCNKWTFVFCWLFDIMRITLINFQKLKHLQSALETVGWPEEYKKKIKGVLTTEYMSSEYSDVDEDGKLIGYVRKPLSWERKKMKKSKKQLMKIYLKFLTARQKQMRLPSVHPPHPGVDQRMQRRGLWGQMTLVP